MLMPIAAAIEEMRMSRLATCESFVGEDAAELAFIEGLAGCRG